MVWVMHLCKHVSICKLGLQDKSHAIFKAHLASKAGSVISAIMCVLSHGAAFTTQSRC